jgi:hypothetical protein
VSDVVPASQYCEESAAFFCDFYLRCGRLAAADPDECRRVFLESCGAKYEPRYVLLEGAGKLALSRAGLDACRDHLAAVACDDQLTDLDGPCGALWVGTGAIDAPCGLDLESLVCAPGLRCRLDLSFCGKCVREAGVGEACDGASMCRPGSRCVSGKCVERGRPGEACAESSECVIGAACSGGVCVGPARAAENGSCARGERCPYRTACVSGRCQRQALLGEACGEAGCATGRCVGGACVALLPAGEACERSSKCATGPCLDGRCGTTPGSCFPR